DGRCARCGDRADPQMGRDRADARDEGELSRPGRSGKACRRGAGDQARPADQFPGGDARHGFGQAHRDVDGDDHDRAVETTSLALFGPADGSHLPARSAAAEELFAAIGFEPRYVNSWRHLDLLENLARFRIDSPQFALVPLPSAVPELAVGPAYAGDETVGF